MNHREFFELVAKMRCAQNDYFRARDQFTLRRCKAIEKEVDTEIQRVYTIINQEEHQHEADMRQD